MPARQAPFALLGLMLLAGAARAGDLDDCNAAVPTPPAATRPLAEAYWLDAHTLQWPGLTLQPGDAVLIYTGWS